MAVIIIMRLLDVLSISITIESIDVYIGLGTIGNLMVTILLGTVTSYIAARLDDNCMEVAFLLNELGLS